MAYQQQDSSQSGDRNSRNKPQFTRKKMCRFCADDKIPINYKEVQMLKYFVTDRGKMIPRRISGSCAKHQRKLAVAIKRARMLALMPFAVTGR